ncbi:restriction endonuclease subunit S [Bacillus sp. REN16]|uniref:restriction endonuclease subunit S n=1 Tax=Bacillus sp. REN16 TaxID=2887296 RepID=UPI002B4BC27B|nr:restriction endonuclease subunit S [Bacillus sp. REN16]
MGDKNSPEIRFPGFSGKWEQMKLGEVVEIKDSARISNTLWVSKGVPYLRSSDLANDEIVGELFISDETYQSYKDKTGAPEKDDLLFTSGGKVGVTYHKIDDKPVYVQGGSILYAKTSKSNKLSGIYLKAFFSSPMMTKYIEGASTGLTIKHFTLKPANAAPIPIPSLKEQNKIGEFFKQIDDIIAFHQQELSILEQTKQGFLQKMFPKEGESVPEVRFPGFTGEWERRKMGEILKVNSGRDYKHLQQGNIPVYGTGGYMLSVNDKLSDEDAIGIGRKGTIDNPQLLKAPFWTVDTLFYMTTKGKNDLLFCYSLANKIHWKKYDESTGVPSLSKNSIDKISISIPTLEEQMKIGNFFKQLDDTIALHQRELDALKETKKAFLQKMFV